MNKQTKIILLVVAFLLSGFFYGLGRSYNGDIKSVQEKDKFTLKEQIYQEQVGACQEIINKNSEVLSLSARVINNLNDSLDYIASGDYQSLGPIADDIAQTSARIQTLTYEVEPLSNKCWGK